MRLDTLLTDLELVAVHGDPAETEVTAVTHDSRSVVPGALFCCVRGLERDGHAYAADAVARGAGALLCERRLPVEVTQLEVAEVRREMGRVAAAFHGNPSRAVQVCGVTGTNGKTTVAHLLRAVLEAHGVRTGLLGTLSGARTTPESTDLQRTLAEMRDAGTQAVAMEVSSHALALHRVEGTWFAVAVFTNLSRDHLDFHGSMEEYFQAKARLFEPGRAAVAVVNLDDPHGRLLSEAALVPTRGYSLADAADVSVGVTSSTFRWEGEIVRVPMGGAFNVANALAAASAARELGVPASTVADGITGAPPVPGRFEPIDESQPFGVVVDYAHTPDALERAIAAARAAAPGRVTVVFGCGGDRDPSKRPLMGAVAARAADRVLVTNDNPRSEDPGRIIAEILEGAAGAGPHGAALLVEPDRREAIRAALAGAGAGDAVVIAGKGHETEQVLADRRVPFDDREVARSELRRLRSAAAW